LTSEDRELDPSSLFQSDTLKLYRLAKRDYANLSGVGAAKVGGRWNRIGQEAICTSTEISTPWLERLVHTPKDVIPKNLALIEIHLDLSGMSAPQNGPLVVHASLKEARFWSARFQPQTSPPIAMAVPSVIVPVWNVVLYLDAPGFWDRVSLASVEPVEFDPRLFPLDAREERA
jgi:RES domain-containing protein